MGWTFTIYEQKREVVAAQLLFYFTLIYTFFTVQQKSFEVASLPQPVSKSFTSFPTFTKLKKIYNNK